MPQRQRERVTTDFTKDDGRTRQAGKDEADVNYILNKYKETGELPRRNEADPQYGDYSTVGTYEAALQTVIAAREAFEGLPSQVRDRMQNNPANLVAFLNDENNRAEAVGLGLVTAPEPRPETPVETPPETPPANGGE